MDLDDIRRQIDDVDGELLKLFCRRMELARSVAEYKIENSLPVLRPERETEILTRVQEESEPEFRAYAKDFFENLMRISREMQQNIIDEV